MAGATGTVRDRGIAMWIAAEAADMPGPGSMGGWPLRERTERIRISSVRSIHPIAPKRKRPARNPGRPSFRTACRLAQELEDALLR